MAKGLGKGLGQLIPDADVETFEDSMSGGDKVKKILIKDIEPNGKQPRKFFDKEKLSDLADSIKEHGVIQPIIVVPKDDGGYMIVAGERRYRAAKMAGLREIPAIVRTYDEITTHQVALIENLQRENLNAIEEAKGYKDLMDNFGLTQEEISKKVSKSRPAVANSLRLLNLPDEVIKMIEDGELSSGQARAILGIDDPALIKYVAHKVVKEGLNVRKVEKLVNDIKNGKSIDTDKDKDKPLDPVRIELDSIENELTGVVGSKVRIINKKNKGKIEIEYYSDDDLEKMIEFLKKYKN